MKGIVPFIAICLLVGGISVWSCGGKNDAHSVVNSQPAIEYKCEQPEPEVQIIYRDREPTVENGDRPSRETAIHEVEMLWTYYYDDSGIKKNHKRRKRFHQYAEHLVDAVRRYQDEETDIGGRLPKDRYTHLVVATMAALETGVNHRRIGRSHGEVGLLQIHGKGALGGHSRREVINNASLGLFLGVRWLAYHTQFCKETRKGIDKWMKPLSLYGAGLAGGRNKYGKCKEISVARKRVRLTKIYKNRIIQATRS